jgi:cellulose synthase/poly-beta-1,6-N-acetylglucosamine synthase-like glycosyltransferase
VAVALDSAAPSGPLIEPAASSPIAVAARAFGDDFPQVRQRWIRVAGVAYLAAAVFYLPWLLTSLNGSLQWLIWPFWFANLVTLAHVLLSVFNSWWRSAPVARLLAIGAEPTVGVIIPTCGEPIPMVLRTIISVLEQDWPHERLVIVVSDDGHDPELEAAVAHYPVLYYSPPPRFAPGRDGAAKAGNLNAALRFLDEMYPGLAYIETRDADDELASRQFLRQAIGQLEADERLAYVQTIKEAQVSAGDPFNNREAIFYRGQMLARNAAKAVFPCGSGVVWRRTALRDIGEFPTWNLVEDLQSGVEALCRGWRGLYVPIVGAVPQHSPEDVPNFYKQRGTWALDTVRLVLWRGLRGMSLRQKAQFFELMLFYVSSFTVLIYLPAIAASLLGYVPIESSTASFLAHMLPIVIATEVWFLALNHPYNDRRRRQRHLYRDLWRVRTMWAGLAPVFMKATVLAVVNGPDRKPSYKVTRKHDDLRWHWRDTLPQATIVLAVVATLVYGIRFGTLPSPVLLLGTVYWGGLNVILLGNFVTRGWHGLSFTRSLFRRVPETVDSTP